MAAKIKITAKSKNAPVAASDEASDKKKKVPCVKDLSGSERLKFLQGLAGDCNKVLKSEGKVYLGGNHVARGRVPTGILAFDIITGGGFIRGGATEIYGQESSGKTSIIIEGIKNCQMRGGGVVLWLIGEGVDIPYLKKRGVKTDDVLFIEAQTGSLGCETAITVLETGALDMLIFDSVQSLATAAEMEGGVDSVSVAGAGAGQMWGRVMRKAYAFANSRRSDNTAIVLVSQVRDKIGSFGKYKPPPEPTGIRAIRHWKDISVQCKAGEVKFLHEDDDVRRTPLYRDFLLMCAKNKTAVPLRSGIYRFYYHEDENNSFGIDTVEQLFRYGKAYGLIELKGGGTCEGFGLKVKGRDVFMAKLRSDKALQKAMYSKLLALGLKG